MITNSTIAKQTGIERAQQRTKTNFERVLLINF